MGRPITWQTLMGPDPAMALRPMESAQRSMNGVFDSMAQALKEREAIASSNAQNEVKRNTEAAMGQLFAIDSAEAFEQAQKSGALTKLMQTPGVDQQALRVAIDGRLAKLQERGREGMAFKNAVASQADIDLDRAEQPVTYQVKALLADGKPQSLAQARALTSGLSARGQASMLGLLDAREQELVRRDRGNKEWGWKEKEEQQRETMRPLEVKAKEASIRASNASTAASAEATLSSRATRLFNEEERRRADARAKLSAELSGNLYADGVFSAKDAPEAMAALEKYKIGGEGSDGPIKRAKIIQELEKISSTGIDLKVIGADGAEKTVNIKPPKALVMQSLLGAQDQTFSWNGGYAANLRERLEKSLREQTVVEQIGEDGNPRQVSVMRAPLDYASYLRTLERATENAPRNTKK